MQYKDIKFLASPTPFRHLGFFPEQASHWDFIEEKIKEWEDVRRQGSPDVGRLKFLNLFGYTGVASFVRTSGRGRSKRILMPQSKF